jgi:paraquat-inducible protein B
MSARANYFKLGLFIITGVAIGIIALIAFGLGAYFKKPIIVETYIDESVQGLDAGSKVKLRGVAVGSVSRIIFTHVRYQLDKPLGERKHYVLIEFALDPDSLLAHPGDSLSESLELEIQRGLRVRLASQGVTGLTYLEMDYVDPDKNEPMQIDWTPANHYVPSAPSTTTRLLTAAETVFNRLDQIDLEALATNLIDAVIVAKEKLAEVDVVQLNRNANQLLEETQRTVAQLQRTLRAAQLDLLATNVNSAILGVRRLVDSGEIQTVIQQLDQTLRRADQLLASNEADLGQAVGNLRALTESLRDLAENARRYPGQLLFGQPPKPIKLEPK